MVYAAKSFNLNKINRLTQALIMGKRAPRIPCYAEDVRLAMKVQRKMAALGYCCFSVKADFDYCYQASFTHFDSHDKVVSIEVEDSMALAITAAALMARGVSLTSLLKRKRK
jgi:hypothetical protein